MMREGPNRTELDELIYVFKARVKAVTDEGNNAIRALGPDILQNNREVYANLRRVMDARRRDLHQQQNEQYGIIRERQLADIARTGINPDAVQELARERARLVRQEEMRLRVEEFRARQNERQRAIVNANHAEREQRIAALPRDGLGGFANDRQNVHTTTAVKQTMDVIKEILKIEVPSEYKWNMKVVSKTLSEIITECELTPASAWQMVAKYCSDERIYELQPGIYGKVLDCVWQYIKSSPDKEDLKKILKSEMKDNIGMCAQGNLSRLTNILAGYVECVVVVESLQDKLGRMLPPLMEIEDLAQRLIAAARIFVEIELPENQWEAWAYGLLIDQETDDYRELFIHDGMIDFIVHT